MWQIGFKGDGPFGTTELKTEQGTVLFLGSNGKGVFTPDGKRAYKVYNFPLHNERDIFKFEKHENKLKISLDTDDKYSIIEV